MIITIKFDVYKALPLINWTSIFETITHNAALQNSKAVRVLVSDVSSWSTDWTEHGLERVEPRCSASLFFCLLHFHCWNSAPSQGVPILCLPPQQIHILFNVYHHNKFHPSIHLRAFSFAYSRSGWGGSRLSEVLQASFSPATLSSSS